MIQSIRLQQFRSYTDTSYEFELAVNIIVGPNGSGKTNLIEALIVAARGSSYRTSDGNLVQHGCDWARIDVSHNGVARAVKIIQSPKPDKSFILADSPQKTLRFDQIIPVVVFEPNNLQLFTQSPELRRGYLDDVLSQTDKSYRTLLQNYKRTLLQRNKLLKQTNVSSDMFFVWNVRLSELGAQLAMKRHEFVAANQHHIEHHYNELVDKPHKILVTYISKIPLDNYGERMLHELEKRTELDRVRGFTSLGPHRDDLSIQINDHELTLAASRGETRTIVLALKLVEATVTEHVRGERPILLLDDVFSELDGSRRKNLTKHLSNYQSFITTTDADIVAHHFTDHTNIIAAG
jgi:DNA replication and repair protein RecF